MDGQQDNLADKKFSFKVVVHNLPRLSDRLVDNVANCMFRLQVQSGGKFVQRTPTFNGPREAGFGHQNSAAGVLGNETEQVRVYR